MTSTDLDDDDHWWWFSTLDKTQQLTFLSTHKMSKFDAVQSSWLVPHSDSVKSSQSGIHQICSSISFLEFISLNAKREICCRRPIRHSHVACWWLHESHVLYSTGRNDCYWSMTHYQKVILRTKTLISHLADSVIAVAFATYQHQHRSHSFGNNPFSSAKRQAKNDSFEFRITFAWDAHGFFSGQFLHFIHCAPSIHPP